MIKTSKGKDAIGIPAARAHFIEPFENDDRELPEHGYTYRRHEDLGFLEALLEPAEKASLTQGSRLDCLLIGNRSLQANEIEEPSFAVTVSGGDWLRGRLKDALRVRSLGCHMNYRTEVLSGEMGKAPSFLRETEPIVIFDGARHFVRWHLQLPLACGWVVMLDRTDRRTDEALAILEDLYVMKRLDDDHADAFPSPQAEIRFKTFKTRRGV